MPSNEAPVITQQLVKLLQMGISLRMYKLFKSLVKYVLIIDISLENNGLILNQMNDILMDTKLASAIVTFAIKFGKGLVNGPCRIV